MEQMLLSIFLYCAGPHSIWNSEKTKLAYTYGEFMVWSEAMTFSKYSNGEWARVCCEDLTKSNGCRGCREVLRFVPKGEASILYSGPHSHRLAFNPSKYFVDDKGDTMEGGAGQDMTRSIRIRKCVIKFHIMSLISHFNSLNYNSFTSKI